MKGGVSCTRPVHTCVGEARCVCVCHWFRMKGLVWVVSVVTRCVRLTLLEWENRVASLIRNVRFNVLLFTITVRMSRDIIQL